MLKGRCFASLQSSSPALHVPVLRAPMLALVVVVWLFPGLAQAHPARGVDRERGSDHGESGEEELLLEVEQRGYAALRAGRYDEAVGYFALLTSHDAPPRGAFSGLCTALSALHEEQAEDACATAVSLREATLANRLALARLLALRSDPLSSDQGAEALALARELRGAADGPSDAAELAAVLENRARRDARSRLLTSNRFAGWGALLASLFALTRLRVRSERSAAV